MNLQKFLPILLLVFLLLFVLPAILHKKSSSSGLSAKELSQETISAMNIVDRGQKSFKSEHGRYTSHVADLVEGSQPLAKALADGVVIQLDASTSGGTFTAQVASGYLVLVRVVEGGKTVAHSCQVLKSGSGVACPTPPAKTTTSTTTTTTGTTTTT
jgi:hypothetical protein